MLVGYARTSTIEQAAGLAGQNRDLVAAGADRVFAEQISSIVGERPQLEAAISFARDGDSIVVTKPDRLARSTADLLALVARLQRKGVALIVLSMGGEKLDTRNPTSKLMLTILAGVATWEREIMLERQRDGIAKAKAAGKYTGRKPTVRNQAAEILRLKAEGLGTVAIARQIGANRVSVFRILRDAKPLDGSRTVLRAE